MGKDVNTIITKLQEYSDFVLSKEKPEDGSFQIEKERDIIENYIKMVKQTKSFFI